MNSICLSLSRSSLGNLDSKKFCDLPNGTDQASEMPLLVLMNLTNDNLVCCQQIATYRGLETLSSLIIGHFPSFSSSLPSFNDVRNDTLSSKSSLEVDHQNDSLLSDQELDFLVAILGLLINLVDKDGHNR
ncbi:hypothetical protein LOK49_LG05G03638 [Camellia lanceoleosa]|uniref:Uncharacterized protein n=1 Tax=Camellia lanceoleosa TaxID=1840588 RepID=A0ACC0HJX7_9ERIC|nr:hypothetical protein LOK49_LG05G03638 [Camellia lanceoleosa]